MKHTSCIYNGPVNRCLLESARIGGCARIERQEPHLGKKLCESPLHGKKRMNSQLNLNSRIRIDMPSRPPSPWTYLPSNRRSVVGIEAKARAKEKAVRTRSKEEDSHGWISILETVHREGRTTLEATRHRINLVSISETADHANMAITVDGAMTLM